VNTLKKDKKWQEDLKGRIKKLKERAKEKPKPQMIYANVSGKPAVIEKDEYAEIKLLPEEKFEKKIEKPVINVKIEKENHYAVIKPIIDEIKEITKEEIHEKIIKSEKILQEKEREKAQISREKAVTPKMEISREKALPPKIEYVGIETTIDRLINILEKRGSVSTIDLSKELGVSIERIESWAKIFEDRGLIDIEYPLIGSSKLRKKEWKKES